MIYVVSNRQFNSSFLPLTVEDSLKMIDSWSMIQFDTETIGLDPHLNTLLCAQFGDPSGSIQIVVDCTTIDIKRYKQCLESKYILGHNLKFDIKMMFKYDIVPRHVYDTMIVEQFLYLGYPKNILKLSLAALVDRYLGIPLDKHIRKEIEQRGLDDEVIQYAAKDVVYIIFIMKKQLQIIRNIPNAKIGAAIECDFTPVVAYLEWCGIKLDEKKWRDKMQEDRINLTKSLKALNDYCMSEPVLRPFIQREIQLDLFQDTPLEPYFNIDWQKDESKKVFKLLGFDLTVLDKETKEEKESILEKHLKSQKGVNDHFLDLYFTYQEYYKRTTSFSQNHLNAVNPKTGRLHTEYNAIGTVSGRMSSGNTKINKDLAKLKGLPLDVNSKQRKEGLACSYPNMQQLPHDAVTRACFVAEPGNLFCSCDWSAMEARLGAEIYDEKVLLDEFLYGSGDTHAAYAKAVWPEELKDIPTKEIKAKRPDLRNKVKNIEFAIQFGSDGTAVAPQLGCSVEEAKQLVNKLLEGMQGLKQFKSKGSQMVRKTGYVPILPATGHRIYWYGWKKWKEEEAMFTPVFWNEYRNVHKPAKDSVYYKVKAHFEEASKWDRMALNGPTQGGGAILLKKAATKLFNWIIDNGYFNKILLVNFTHDEINSEFPEELKDTYPNIVATIMGDVGKEYFHRLPIPAEAEVGPYWIH